MKIVAIKDMSDGNESAGETWKETKIFDGSTPIEDVMRWAEKRNKNVTITVPAGEEWPGFKP